MRALIGQLLTAFRASRSSAGSTGRARQASVPMCRSGSRSPAGPDPARDARPPPFRAHPASRIRTQPSAGSPGEHGYHGAAPTRLAQPSVAAIGPGVLARRASRGAVKVPVRQPDRILRETPARPRSGPSGEQDPDAAIRRLARRAGVPGVAPGTDASGSAVRAAGTRPPVRRGAGRRGITAWLDAPLARAGLPGAGLLEDRAAGEPDRPRRRLGGRAARGWATASRCSVAGETGRACWQVVVDGRVERRADDPRDPRDVCGLGCVGATRQPRAGGICRGPRSPNTGRRHQRPAEGNRTESSKSGELPSAWWSPPTLGPPAHRGAV
jgi:hypothetical protein